MIEILAAALGVAVLVVFARVALIWLPKQAREDAAPHVRRAAVLIFLIAVAGAAAWWPYRVASRYSASRALLKEQCTKAREEILRTVDEVDGFLMQPTQPSGAIHHDDALPSLRYLRNGRYQFVEVESASSDQPISRYEAGEEDYAGTPATEPASRYAVTWKELADPSTRDLNVYGDETVIYDLQTREVLARRVAYYYLDMFRKPSDGPKFQGCPQIDLGKSTAYPDPWPRDSYLFVSRVLKPAEGASEAAAVADTEPALEPSPPEQLEPPAAEELQAARVEPVTAPTEPATDEFEIPPPPSPKIARWVDKNGVVHYTDPHRAPPER